MIAYHVTLRFCVRVLSMGVSLECGTHPKRGDFSTGGLSVKADTDTSTSCTAGVETRSGATWFLRFSTAWRSSRTLDTTSHTGICLRGRFRRCKDGCSRVVNLWYFFISAVSI